MNLVEFIKSKISRSSQFKTFANDVLDDKNFPVEKSEEEIIDYLNFQTKRGDTNETFQKLLKEYKKHIKNNQNKIFDFTEAKFSVLKSEHWKYYKENFPVDKVYLVGKDSDIYKIYFVDSKSKTALYIDPKSDTSLNDTSIYKEENIRIGNATREVSVIDALNLLEKCTYDSGSKPNAAKFLEIIDFLRLK
ncbi:MAG: hypothetical protein JWM14_3137 [Chitinophagaceae bacterium]|nr:hypothetical protein [Chitinophagaceae bacterium]